MKKFNLRTEREREKGQVNVPNKQNHLWCWVSKSGFRLRYRIKQNKKKEKDGMQI